jgi:DNA-binding XRE family transcriptional regulator
MRETKRKRLEARGWRVGNAQDFLGLSPEEAAYVEMKVRLAEAVRARRQASGLSQTALARQMGSSQSRIAKIEAGDPTVSVDLLHSAARWGRNQMARRWLGPRWPQWGGRASPSPRIGRDTRPPPTPAA